MSDRKETVQELLNAAVEDQTLRNWRLMGEAAENIERLTRERDEAEKRGYLKGLSDAQLAIHHADVLWAHSRAIDALKAKAKE